MRRSPPLLVLVARKRPLKQILLVLVTIFTLGNVLSCMAPNYHALLTTRFISGLPHGAYFGVDRSWPRKWLPKEKVPLP